MKVLFGLALSALLTPSLQAQEKISFQTARQAEGTTLYLYAPSVLRLTRLDSAKVMPGGKTSFTVPKGLVRGVYKIGPAKGQPTELVLGGTDKSFTEAADGRVKGGKEQSAYQSFKEIEANTQAGFMQLQEQYNRMAKEGMTPPEQVKITSLFRKKSDSIYLAQDKAYTEFAAKNVGTHAGKWAAFLIPAKDEQEKTYFPGTAAQLAEQELAWPNIIQQKMVIWLQRYLPQDLETYEKATLEAIDRAPAGSRFKENLFGVSAMVFASMDQEFLRPIANQWIKYYPNNTQAKELLAQLPQPQPEVGDMAPDIVLKDSTGKDLKLSSLRGKVVLIDFWASWCGPCRQENPNVVRTYEQYKDKGFTIFSVSLDQDRGRWINAIAKDKLSWPSHVSDLKGWQSAGAQLYRVNSIPATFLIDKDGKIIAKNLRGGKLESELQKLIK